MTAPGVAGRWRPWLRWLAIALAVLLGLFLALAVVGAVLPNASADPDEWRPDEW